MLMERWFRLARLSAVWVLATAATCTGSTPVTATRHAAPAYGDAFRRHWHDGKAELAGYELVYPRYGEARRGTAVTVFVTEPFDGERHVKPEDPRRADFSVLKLNLIQDFATGIYDYNLMTSVFAATEPVGTRPAGAVTKVSFSSQEWCGHVYAQVRFEDRAVQYDSHSYFEGEADQQQAIEYPAHGLSEDALLLWARGLAGPVLAPGEQIEVPLLRSLEEVRVRHRPLTWDRAKLSRGAGTEILEPPAGKIETFTSTVEIVRADAEKSSPPHRWRFDVEAAFPHRIVRWQRGDGVQASLLGSTRLPYWQLHDRGQEALLAELGLRPRPLRTP